MRFVLQARTGYLGFNVLYTVESDVRGCLRPSRTVGKQRAGEDVWNEVSISTTPWKTATPGQMDRRLPVLKSHIELLQATCP